MESIFLLHTKGPSKPSRLLTIHHFTHWASICISSAPAGQKYSVWNAKTKVERISKKECCSWNAAYAIPCKPVGYRASAHTPGVATERKRWTTTTTRKDIRHREKEFKLVEPLALITGRWLFGCGAWKQPHEPSSHPALVGNLRVTWEIKH